MSREQLRAKQCGNKVKYRTPEEVHKAIQEAKERGIPRHISSYVCPWCGFFHWGHSPFHIMKQDRREYHAQPVRRNNN